MAPAEIRDRRRILRYRNLVLKQSVQMKNRVSGLMMETGVSYNKQRLHKLGYFEELMTTNEDVHDSIRPLLRLSREMISRSQKLDYGLISSVERDPLLKERIRRLAASFDGKKRRPALSHQERSFSGRLVRNESLADSAPIFRCSCPRLCATRTRSTAGSGGI
jgi:hypothetical protein